MSLSSELTATTVSQAQYTPVRSWVSSARRGEENYSYPSFFKASVYGSQLLLQNTNNFSVHPVIPGMFIPPHPAPAAPSHSAIVRWWFSQDYESHRLECSITGFATQLAQNTQKLRLLEEEGEDLKQELSQALERKRQVRHRPTLPNYKQMYRNFDAALETMRTIRHDLPLHQCTCTRTCTCPHEAAPSYPEWLVPRKQLRWYSLPPPFTLPPNTHSFQGRTADMDDLYRWEWGMLAPGQTAPRVMSLPEVGNWSASAPALPQIQPRPAAVTFAAPVSLPTLALPPLFGPPPSADPVAVPESLPPSDATPPAAPAVPVTPPPPKSLSLADRLRDPTGIRARPPTPPPPASPRPCGSQL